MSWEDLCKNRNFYKNYSCFFFFFFQIHSWNLYTGGWKNTSPTCSLHDPFSDVALASSPPPPPPQPHPQPRLWLPTRCQTWSCHPPLPLTPAWALRSLHLPLYRTHFLLTTIIPWRAAHAVVRGGGGWVEWWLVRRVLHPLGTQSNTPMSLCHSVRGK